LVVQWLANTYTGLDGPTGWRTATGQEMLGSTQVGQNIDPQLANPGQTSAPTGNPDFLQVQLTTYSLLPGSPLSRAGLNLTSLGVAWDPYNYAGNSFLTSWFNATPTDFFGHSLVGRTTFSMGVDQEGS
jgi:hypothetical protein